MLNKLFAHKSRRGGKSHRVQAQGGQLLDELLVLVSLYFSEEFITGVQLPSLFRMLGQNIILVE